MNGATFETLAVFGAALACVIIRPGDLPEAVPAVAGAALMVLLGRITPPAAAAVLWSSSEVFLFLGSVLLFSALVERSGLFGWSALWAARGCAGSARRLFILLFLLATVVTALFSLDTTVVMLTPLIYAAARHAGVRPRPFLLACVFAANTASALLPVSNPANFLFAASFHIGFAEWARDLAPATAMAVLAVLLLFLFHFRTDLDVSIDMAALPPPASAIRQPGYFRACALAVALLFTAFFIGPWWGLAAGATAAAGAAALLVWALLARVITPLQSLRDVPWGLLAFTAGLFVQVGALERLPLAAQLARGLASLGRSPLRAAAAGAATAAAGSNLINNLPMSLLALSLARIAPLRPPLRIPLAYGFALGCDLGPNLTLIGSLATLLWLAACRKQGEAFGAAEYAALGWLATPLALGAALLVLAIQWRWISP